MRAKAIVFQKLFKEMRCIDKRFGGLAAAIVVLAWSVGDQVYALPSSDLDWGFTSSWSASGWRSLNPQLVATIVEQHGDALRYWPTGPTQTSADNADNLAEPVTLVHFDSHNDLMEIDEGSADFWGNFFR